MLEGTDGRAHYLRYTPELDEARSRGDLTTNSFIVINKSMDENRRRRIGVANLGNAEALLENRDHFRSLAKRLLQRTCLHGESLRGWWSVRELDRQIASQAFESLHGIRIRAAAITPAIHKK